MLSPQDRRASMEITTVLALLLLHSIAAAEPAAAPVVEEIWVSAPTGGDLAAARGPDAGFAEGLRIDPSGAPTLRMWVTPAGRERLTSQGYHLSSPPPALPAGLDAYRSVEQGTALLEGLASSAPRAGRVRLGTSVEGRPIDGVWFGQPPGSEARVLRVVGAHHGDEWSSFEVPLALASTLAELDGVEAQVTALLDDSTVWVVPFVNPDGVAAGNRFNANFVDLNRNYGYRWNPDEFLPGDAPFSEPETRAMRSWGHWERPMVGLSAHSGATNFGWVWNHTTEPTPDLDILVDLSQDYEERCTTRDFYITNGAAWYVTEGDSNDWSYGRYGVLDFTVELTEPKTPPGSEIPEYVDDHLGAVLAFLGTAPTLSGTVRDAATGEPVEARLVLDGDVASSEFASAPTTGRFYRVTPEGAAVLGAYAPGYQLALMPVELGSAAALELELTLEPVGQAEGVVLPARGSGVLDIELPIGLQGPVSWVHAGAATVRTEVDGQHTQFDTTSLAPGWWSATMPGGAVWRNAVLVEEPLGVTLDAWYESGDGVWTVDGAGFAQGTRVFAVWGKARHVRELQVLSETESQLELDNRTVPADERVDLAVVTSGATVGIDDAWTPRLPGLSADLFADERLLVGGRGCACASMPGHLGSAPLSNAVSVAPWWLGLTLARRGRTRRSSP